jgi:kinesin family member 11
MKLQSLIVHWHTRKLRNESDQFRMKELESPNRHSERIDQQLQRLQEAAQLIEGNDEIPSTAITTIQSLVKLTNDLLNGGFGSWFVCVTKSCDVLCKELEATGAAGFAAVGFSQ